MTLEQALSRIASQVRTVAQMTWKEIIDDTIRKFERRMIKMIVNEVQEGVVLYGPSLYHKNPLKGE